MIEYIGNIELDEKLEDKKLVIYGIGEFGRKIYKFLKNNGLQANVLCFCVSDNENAKCNIFQNIQVKTLSEAIKMSPDAEYLIGGKYAYEMLDELERRHINKIHLLFL